MPHKDMTEGQWRDKVMQKFAEGDARFKKLEDGQVEMLTQIKNAGELRHRENINRMERLEGVIVAHTASDTTALATLDTEMKKNTAVCESIAGVVRVGRGTKSVVRWLWTQLPAIASAVSSLTMLGLVVWWLFFNGPLPPVGGH